MLGITTAALLLAVAAGNGHAALIIDDPDSSALLAGTTNGTANLGGCDAINDAFGLGLDPCDLLLHYKIDFDTNAESGPFAGDYSTVFVLDGGEPTGATITNDGLNSIDCPECYLLVKDGNAQPAQYLFNIGTWNGTDPIELTNFWASVSGAISNIAIWSGENGGPGDPGEPGGDPLPVPAPIALIGLGAVALGWATRKARTAADTQS
jgi:hypothetical protein